MPDSKSWDGGRRRTRSRGGRRSRNVPVKALSVDGHSPTFEQTTTYLSPNRSSSAEMAFPDSTAVSFRFCWIVARSSGLLHRASISFPAKLVNGRGTESIDLGRVTFRLDTVSYLFLRPQPHPPPQPPPPPPRNPQPRIETHSIQRRNTVKQCISEEY